MDSECKELVKLLQAKIARLRIIEKEYNHWRDDDLPKGETVPGVRYW